MGRSVAASAEVEKILKQQPAAEAGQGYESVTRAVLFTDIVGSTAYFEQRGDEAGLAMVERHNELLFPLVAEHGGTVIKTIGDAIMAGYESAASAIRSAVAMQQRLKLHNAEQPADDRISVRIGVNYGRVLTRGQDLFGDVVNAAARVESLARGGQVLVSTAVEQQLGDSFPVPRSLYDAVRVKGKREPVEVFEVRWDPEAEAEPITARTRFEIGKLLGGRFEIVAQIGEGGMGQVYEARDHALDETVALKFVRADLAADPETLSRFKTEVKLARSVTHPNICRIHEFLEMEGRVFLSMEVVRGLTLSELMADGKALGPDRVTGIISGICAGLQAAHDRGIVHRDLKPANVMIEEGTGRVVLMDFGIAQLASTRRTTEAGVVVGTPEYMSPEQVRGETVGPASDIYALGVIIYQMLTGRPPHIGNTPVEVALMHLNAEPVPVREIEPGCPARLAGAVARCLAKKPRDRFEDARSAALAVTGDPAPTAQARPSRTIWTLLAFAVVALAVVVAVLQSAGAPAGPAAGSWRPRVLVSSMAVDSLARYSPDGRFVAFLREGDLWLLDPGNNTRRITTGASAVAAEGLGGLCWTRDGKDLLYTSRDGDELRTLRVGAFGGKPATVAERAAAADLSPDGQRLAYVAQDEQGNNGIAVSRSDGTGPGTILAGDAGHSYLGPRWSPDGERLALVVHKTGYSSTRDIGVLDVDSGSLTMLTTDGADEQAYNTDPAWTPDGKWIVYASKRGGSMSLWQVPAEGGDSTHLTRGGILDRREPDVNPDGSRIAFSTRENQLDIELVHLETGDGRTVTQDVWTDRFPVFSPDGLTVAYRAQRYSDDPDRRTLVLHELQSRDEKTIPAPEGLRELAWCGPTTIVYAATAGERRMLGRLDLTSRKTEVLIDSFHRLWSPACSPNGKQVVFTGQQLRADPRDLWLLDTSQGAPRRLSADRGLHSYPVFSPDGRSIAFRWAPSRERLGEAELRLAQPGKGKMHRTVTSAPSFRRSQRRIRFSADGRALYYMESIHPEGRLWKVPATGGRPTPVLRIRNIHTFDFDLSPDDKTLVIPRVTRSGDLFVLQRQD